jgi:large subunit ribosomal protein L15
MIGLHNLPAAGGKTRRVGRGPGSGAGKTAGRGMDGQKSRTGHRKMPARFEGGQMPMHMRLPKLRGFRNPLTDETATVTVAQAARAKGSQVGLAELQQAGIIARRVRRIKLVAGGDARNQTINAYRATPAAIKAVEKAGGKVTVAAPVEKSGE